MEELIEKAVILFKKEAEIINKMLTFVEKDQESKFIAYTEYYKKIKEQSDALITEMLDKYLSDDIMLYVIDHFKEDKDDLMAMFTFVGLADCESINRTGREIFGNDMDSFMEEHNRLLLSIYLWGIKNEEINEKERKALHDLIILTLTSSQFVRNYFAGDYEKASNISSPDYNFGSASANQMALKSYYAYLNKLVYDSNTFEMFDDMEDQDTFNARKRQLKYELVAICAQIEERGFTYPCLEVPMSDFTEEILKESSIFNEKYKADKKLAKRREVICL